MANVTDYRGWPHLMCSGFDCDRRALMSFDKIYSFLKELPEAIGMQRMGLPIVYKVNPFPFEHPPAGGILQDCSRRQHSGDRNGRPRTLGGGTSLSMDAKGVVARRFHADHVHVPGVPRAVRAKSGTRS